MSNTKKPFYKTWWFITIIILLVAGTIYGAATGDLQKAINETSTPLAPSAKPTTEGMSLTPSPVVSTPAAVVDYAAALKKQIDEGYPEGEEPGWVYSMQEISNEGRHGVNVRYQLPNMTEGEAKTVARIIFMQASAAESVTDLSSVTVTDATGIKQFFTVRDMDFTTGADQGVDPGRVR